MEKELQEKYDRLIDILKSYGKVAVAFSGGVDSTFLLKAAMETLGAENVLALTAKAETVPERELAESRELCKEIGVRQIILDIDQLSMPCFKFNPPDRCYHCKTAIFSGIKYLARREGFDVIADGTNADDMGDYRPGIKALEELKVKSPLLEAGLGKKDIRNISKILGIPTWKKPSIACLASRIPYYEPITAEKLKMVDSAEQFLIGMGFGEVRVRIHGEGLARIEVPGDRLQELLENRLDIISKFRESGFTYVTIDIEGFRSGSMNEILSEKL